MLRFFCISIAIIYFTFSSIGQVKVVDGSDLIGLQSVRFLPDIEGKVAVDESYFNHVLSPSGRTAVEIFPGWPVSVPGSNERGGIYGNLDNDPELELVYEAGSALFAFNIDGSAVTGWPRTLDFPTDGAPAFGDIDGDGVGEIVVTTHQQGTFAFGTIYAFEKDGAHVTGFPVTTDGGGVRTPVLADLDDDGALEIIITVRDWPDGFVYVYRGDGTLFPNWPQRMDYVPASAVAVGDITGDEIPEIVAESYYGLHAFTTNGVLMPGFPYLPGPGRVFSYSSPVLADLDGDGNREIICGDHSVENGSGAVHIVKFNGNSWVDWPKLTGSWIYGPPSVGDINGDGLLDIAVGDQALSTTPVNSIYAWTAVTGTFLPGFPITEVFGVNSQIILADIDGDGQIELIADDNTAFDLMGKYQGFNHDGTMMENWPLETLGSTFFINPLVADIDFDGILDISGGGTEEASGYTNFYLWNSGATFHSSLAILPILQYNTRHNGVYGDTLMVGLPDISIEVKGRWNVFPNPATNYITLKLNAISTFDFLPQKAEVLIYQSSGQQILHEHFSLKSGDIRINLEGYPSGVYWVEIRSGSSEREMLRFIMISR